MSFLQTTDFERLATKRWQTRRLSERPTSYRAGPLVGHCACNRAKTHTNSLTPSVTGGSPEVSLAFHRALAREVADRNADLLKELTNSQQALGWQARGCRHPRRGLHGQCPAGIRATGPTFRQSPRRSCSGEIHPSIVSVLLTPSGGPE